MRSVFAFVIIGMVLSADAVRSEDPVFNGRKLSEWQTMLKEDPTPRKRRAAVVALGQIALENREVMPVVLVALGRALKTDTSPAVREQAAVVLGQQKVDEKSAGIVPDLVESLRIEREPPVRKAVAVAIGRFGGYAKISVGPLTRALHDAEAGVRAAAADALGRVGGESAAAMPDLILLLKDSDKNVRQSALFALGRIEPSEKGPASAALIAALRNETDPDLRREAVVSLGLLGDLTDAVVQALAQLLSDRDASLRATVALTLGKFGPILKVIESELIKSLREDKDKIVRLNVVRTFCSSTRRDIRQLLSILSERLTSDPDFEVRVAIAEELGSLGAEGLSAIPVLRQAQSDSQIKVREAATAAIRAIEKRTAKSKS